MNIDEYYSGDWTDGNGDVNKVRFKKKWGEHVFTPDESMDLLAGKTITFIYKKRDCTGHLQFYDYEDKRCFGFVADFSDEYEEKPVYDYKNKSSFYFDLKTEKNIMSQFMIANYYDKLVNADKSKVTFKRIEDENLQKKGIDVIYTQNGNEFVIDEKAQMDYIYLDKPLSTFALELLNSSSGKIGWLINDELETKYYMFIWPHANKRPLKSENIEYAYYSLISKEKLLVEIEKKYKKTKSILLEYANKMAKCKMGEEVKDDKGDIIGYRFKGDGFDDEAYLYYTIKKAEHPVNLVVKRTWINKIAKENGFIKPKKTSISVDD